MRQQQNDRDVQNWTQGPLTAREQQYRYPRQQSEQGRPVDYGRRGGYSQGEHRPSQEPRRHNSRPDRDSSKSRQDT